MSDVDRGTRGTGLVTQVLVGVALAVGTIVVLVLIARAGSFEDVERVPHAGPPGAGAVRGVCVDEKGVPMAGVTLRWSASQGSTGGLLGGSVFGSTEHRIVSGEDGGFELGDLPVGQGFLEIDWDASEHPAGDPLREGSSGIIPIEEGTCATGFEVVAEPIPPDRLIEGKVVDGSGVPRPFVMVSSTYDGLTSHWRSNGMSAKDGTFQVVCPHTKGPLTITWERSDGTEGELELDAPGARNLVLRDD